MSSGRPNVCGLILAAGLSSRMGEFKPLMPLRGKTLIENTIDSVFSGGAQSVVVVTGYRAAEVETVLRWCYQSRVLSVRNPDYASTDMLRSIQIGCRAMPGCDAFFLLPGDMPVVRRATFRKLLKAKPADEPSVVFPTLGGYRKHPPLVDAGLIPDILSFHGSGGLRQLWRQHEDLIFTVPVDDIGVWVDLDTQQDYQACRQTYEFAK
ncbi:MAG: nucleotidyltransferase family protein [Oscillibacter sp.]|nr:nucleotidyltransferase family protein [Oscillibacter sp.]MEA4993298.1 nucleotidyltransferase family protein [Oscillibacter sp.]